MTRKRLLLIDGDEALARDVARVAQARGLEAQATGSSSDAFELARSERPDLIVVNVELTPVNGWSICTRLKKDDELKGVPVVLTSSAAGTDTFEKHKKLKTRADEYLLKPYQPSDLLKVAGTLLGLPELASEPEPEAVADPLDQADEPLGLDDATLDEAEEIPIAEDEPLDAEVDPLAMADGEEEIVAYDEPAAPAEVDPLALGDGEEIVAEDYAADEPAPVGELPGEEDLAAFDEAVDTVAETGLDDEPLAYDEAPLEISPDEPPAEPDGFLDEPPEPPPDLGLGAEAFSENTLAVAVQPAGSAPADDARLVEVESALADARDEIERKDAELSKLRSEAVDRERALLDLREELNKKDEELKTLRETERRQTAEAQKAQAERARRDQTVKALTQKAEQLAQQAAKLAKELTRTREEAKEAQQLKADLEAKESDLAEVRFERDQLQQQLDEARKTAERAGANVEQLQEKLAAADERAGRHEALARSHESSLSRLRESLSKLVDELGD